MSVFVLGATVIALTCLAWANRFFQDDAYISLRYASNFVNGHGLVWNPGERVEGYSNFLWTVFMAIPIACGWDPVSFSFAAGMILYATTLVVTYALARSLLRSELMSFAAVVALGTNYTFSCYATGGLETQFQALLVTASSWIALLIVERPSRGLLAIAMYALLATLAMLTRLDSLVLLLGSSLLVIVTTLRGSRPWRARAPGAIALLGIPVVILSAWVAWRWSFYGRLLPNTYDLKLAGPTSILRGVWYVGMFFVTYLLFPFPVLWLGRLPRLLRSLDATRLGLLVAPLVLWTAYMMKIGGDFMEYRLFVPIMPLLMCVLVASAWRLIRHSALRWSVLALIPLGSFVHAVTFDHFSILSRGLVTIPGLVRQLDDPRQDWVGIGRFLKHTFGDANSVRIGVTAAGAIPYYSGLPSVDMLGVNDAWVAKNGVLRGGRPGHQRIATAAYVQARRVNLVIGHPIVLPTPPKDAVEAQAAVRLLWGFGPIPDPESLTAETTILAIPYAPRQTLVCLYLTRSSEIDAAIRNGGWQTFPWTPK